MGGTVGFGLRARIIAGLIGAFFVALSLLGLAFARLTQEVRIVDRRNALEQTAVSVAASIDARSNDDAALKSLEARLIGLGGIEALYVAPGGQRYDSPTGGSRMLHGVAKTRGGAEVVVVGKMPVVASSIASLMGLYIVVTGLAMILLAYVVLTRWIVNPVATLIDASERLARGRLETRVPAGGVAELSRLASAFDSMALSLRSERQELVDRVNELQSLTLELESTQEQLIRGAKLASVGRLAAGIAHEVGNPLAAITGLLELIRDGALEPSERDDFLRRALQETDRISSIISELLDFARVDSEMADEAAGDLVAAVDDVVRLMMPLRRAAPRVEVDSDATSLKVRGSPERLKQIVFNLLLNALDAAGESGTVRIEIRSEGDEGVLRVLDSGPGIDSAVADKLFEPFVTTKTTGKGTGLGLAVTHSLVERLGGSIDGCTREEGGAVFTVRLPDGRLHDGRRPEREPDETE